MEWDEPQPGEETSNQRFEREYDLCWILMMDVSNSLDHYRNKVGYKREVKRFMEARDPYALAQLLIDVDMDFEEFGDSLDEDCRLIPYVQLWLERNCGVNDNQKQRKARKVKANVVID